MFYSINLKRDEEYKFDSANDTTLTLTQVTLNPNSKGTFTLQLFQNDNIFSICVIDSTHFPQISLNLTLIVSKNDKLKLIGPQTSSGSISIFGLYEENLDLFKDKNENLKSKNELKATNKIISSNKIQEEEGDNSSLDEDDDDELLEEEIEEDEEEEDDEEEDNDVKKQQHSNKISKISSAISKNANSIQNKASLSDDEISSKDMFEVDDSEEEIESKTVDEKKYQKPNNNNNFNKQKGFKQNKANPGFKPNNSYGNKKPYFDNRGGDKTNGNKNQKFKNYNQTNSNKGYEKKNFNKFNRNSGNGKFQGSKFQNKRN